MSTAFRANTNTGRSTGHVITQDVQTPAYATTLAITTGANVEETIVQPGALTGVMTITAGVATPLQGDRMRIEFVGDTVDRVVTFSTGFGGITTLTVPGNSAAVALFEFFNSKWVCSTSGTYTSLAADVQSPVYAASIAITTARNSNTVVVPAVLIGALTMTAVLTNALKGDVMTMIFLADTTARVVTFSTGFTSYGTLVVPISLNASIKFVYDGTIWIESSRDDARAVLDVQAPAYSATLTMVTTRRETTYQPATLTGALTINATITSARAGDRVYFSFISDASGQVVTFGTNFKSSGTLSVSASKWAGASAVFNGTFWVLMGREISA